MDATGVPTPWTPGAGEHLAIDRAEVLRYLGYAGQEMEPELADRIEAVVAALEASLAPRGVWAVFALRGTDGDAPEDTDGAPPLSLDGSTVELAGRDIRRHLARAPWCAALAVTLGMDVERRLRTAGSQHPLEAAVLDAAASAAVEAAADALNTEVERRAAAANLLCTWRFSPGYGDLPLDAQPGLLAALNATRLCGITATPTNLLMPTKSVTALVGLFPQAADADGRNQAGQTARPDARPACATCRFASGCSLRARGETCGRSAPA